MPLAALLAGALLVPAGAPVSAKDAVLERSSDSYLCTGYAGCEAAGHSSHGYRERGGSMYWRMYSGHNCTNYVAYRMIQAGMPNVRPWSSSGSGNAAYWGVYRSDITDQTPAVGAVAWYRANVPGAGSAGHVAYVEKVISPTEIIVSEDSWGGDFHYRRVTTSGSWPSGFIHFADADAVPPLTSTETPVVRGEPQIGGTVRATTGRFKPRVESKSFQWLADGTRIPGATERSFAPGPRQIGDRLSVSVTASTKGTDPLTVTSAASPAVRRGWLERSGAPVVAGEAVVGGVLELSAPTFSPEPGRTEITWSADGTTIEAETGSRLRITDDLRGATITAHVDAFARGYVPRRSTSAAVGPITLPPVVVEEPGSITGTPLAGETLEVDPGRFSPARSEVRYTWLRDGDVLPRQREATYTLRESDVGAWMSVRVDLLRDGYQRTSQTVEAARPVQTTPTLRLRTLGRAQRAVVVLDLTAPGVTEPAGSAEIRVGGQSATVPVEAGRAREVIRGLRPGERTVVVRWLGSDLVLPAETTGTVTVR